MYFLPLSTAELISCQKSTILLHGSFISLLPISRFHYDVLRAIEWEKERVYGPKLYLHDLCFTASLKGLFPTEYRLSDVLSISFWAPETGMNVMSSFGRLCCLPLLWFKATPLWKWVRTDFESWDVMYGTLLESHRPQRSLSSGWATGCLMMDCCDGQKSNYFCLKVCNIMMPGWV